MSNSTAVHTLPATDEALHSHGAARRPMAVNSLRAGLFVLAALTCWAVFALVVDAPSQPGGFLLAIMVGLAGEVAVAWLESRRARPVAPGTLAPDPRTGNPRPDDRPGRARSAGLDRRP